MVARSRHGRRRGRPRACRRRRSERPSRSRPSWSRSAATTWPRLFARIERADGLEQAAVRREQRDLVVGRIGGTARMYPRAVFTAAMALDGLPGLTMKGESKVPGRPARPRRNRMLPPWSTIATSGVPSPSKSATTGVSRGSRARALGLTNRPPPRLRFTDTTFGVCVTTARSSYRCRRSRRPRPPPARPSGLSSSGRRGRKRSRCPGSGARSSRRSRSPPRPGRCIHSP